MNWQPEIIDFCVPQLLVAHPDHFPRCSFNLQKRGFNVCNSSEEIRNGIVWISFGCDEFGYDPLSAQKWTINREVFLNYERELKESDLKKED